MRHESTVVAVENARTWKVVCSCGWESGQFADHYHAVQAESAHIGGSS